MVCACPNPKCKQMFKIDDTFAGRQATCPKCKTPFIIPRAPIETANKQVAPKAIPTAVQVPTPNIAVQPPPVRSSPDSQPAGHASPMPPKVEARGAGLKNAPVPPPLPRSTPAQKAPGPGGPPPLPPKVPGRPPAIPGTISTVAGATINRVVNSLVRALSIRKLCFFLLAATAIGLFLCFLSYGLVKIVMPSEDLYAEDLGSLIGDFVLVFIVIIIIAVGMTGILIGGVAYLTHMEEQGRSVSISDAFRFCGRKFGSLFVGAVIFLMLMLLILVFTNGFMSLLSGSSSMGSLLTALLFLPHFALNLVLLLAIVVSVIIPCAITVENIGPMVAISRFIACVRRDTGHLIVHLVISAFFGAMVTLTLLGLVFFVMLPTFVINSGGGIGILGAGSPFGHAGTAQGFDVEFAYRDSYRIGERLVRNVPFDSGIGNGRHNSKIMNGGYGRERRYRDIFGRSSGQIKIPWDTKLRIFFAALVVAAAISYGSVFWIVSFTNYYRGVRPKISTIALRRAGP
jgi:hypothetical protein